MIQQAIETVRMYLGKGSGDGVPIRGGFRVETVKGTVRVLGPHTGEMSGSLYTYVKFDTAEGRELMLEKVGAGNSVASELEPGVSGVFHVIRTGAGAILAAFQADNGRRGDDIAPIVKQMRKQKWDIVQLTGLFTILSPVGIVTVLFTFFTIPIFFFFLFKPLPSEADIRAAIAASAV